MSTTVADDRCAVDGGVIPRTESRTRFSVVAWIALALATWFQAVVSFCIAVPCLRACAMAVAVIRAEALATVLAAVRKLTDTLGAARLCVLVACAVTATLVRTLSDRTRVAFPPWAACAFAVVDVTESVARAESRAHRRLAAAPLVVWVAQAHSRGRAESVTRALAVGTRTNFAGAVHSLVAFLTGALAI